MPHHTTTIAILAAVLVVLFVYQYVGTPSADLDTYIPFSSSAKFGTPVEGLTSNIQDAEDLDWDDLPEAGGDLLMGEGEQAVSSGERKVRIDLGVMSRCPDARLCEAVMDKVFIYPGIRDKIDVRLNYIGRPDDSETYGVRCMHGDRECAGNIHQLCMQQHTLITALTPPTSSSSSDDAPYLSTALPPYWSFTLAQNFLDSPRTGDLEYAKECAKAVGVDWHASGVARCVGQAGADEPVTEETEEGTEGQELLLKSVNKLIDMNVSKSCTILIEDKVRCVHDGSWKNCDEGHEILDFVHSINKEYEKLNA